MLCLEEGRAREGWRWHSLLSPTYTTMQEKMGCFLGITISVAPDQRANTGFVLLMGWRKVCWNRWCGFEELLSIWPTWAKDRLSCVCGCFMNLRYLHWFTRLLYSRLQIFSVCWQVDWCKKSNPGLVSAPNLPLGRKNKINPKGLHLTSVVREMGSCRSQR